MKDHNKSRSPQVYLHTSKPKLFCQIKKRTGSGGRLRKRTCWHICLHRNWSEMWCWGQGPGRVDVFNRVANPSIWMYYFPDPDTNGVSIVYR